MVEPLIRDPVVKKLLEAYRPVWALGHALALLGWDHEVYMPRRGEEERSTAVAELSVLSRKLLLSREVKLLLEAVEARSDVLNDYERGVARVLRRSIDKIEKIPEELVYRKAMVTSKAFNAWREAKQKADFSIFKPYLEEIVEIARKEAEYLGYEGHPYNALLDLYEEGLTVDDVDNMFNVIIPASKEVLSKVQEQGYYPSEHPLEKAEYDRAAMEKANKRVLDLLGFPWDRGRMDVSPHPFTVNMGINDVRITTWYPVVDGAVRDFKRSLYAVIHEFGHALYELQVDERLMFTPIAGGVSLGVHESQSRFWENIVGRSMSFVRLVKPVLDETIGITRSLSEEDLYKYFNIVRPSLIRVEADEVTYNFHIYIRYQIEKRLIEGSLRVDELPEVWNSMYEELLGVRPRNDAEGVLQDVHWSHGSIGYFPTYSIGNVLSAQIKSALEREKGASIEEIIAKGEEGISEIRSWLREKIHRYGSTYPPKTLVEKATGEPMNPEHFVRYLRAKYVR